MIKTDVLTMTGPKKEHEKPTPWAVNPFFFLIFELSLFRVESQLIKINILVIYKIINKAFPVHDLFKKCAANQPFGHHYPGGGDGDPDLSLHCILGRAEEPFDAKMLFEVNQ